MARKRVTEYNDIPKDVLKEAIKKANPRARLESVQCINDEQDFSKGSADSKVVFVYPSTVLRWLRQSDAEIFQTHEADRDCLLLTPKKILKIPSINMSQQFFTPPELVEGYTHIQERHTLQEAYFRVLHDQDQISFRLGDMEKIVRLEYDEKWTWHQTKARLKCVSSRKLEEKFSDPMFVYAALSVAWKYLGVEPLLKPTKTRYIEVEDSENE